MAESLIYSLLATFGVSLLSFAGILTFILKDNLIKKISLYLVAFSTGALIGGAFLHLLAESTEISEGNAPYLYLIVGISIFFILERYLKWHHCHNEEGECEVHTFTYMSLFGDGLHNFIDGLVIVSAFMINKELGIATTIAVASHELPQELGDFGVLVHGGFSKIKALFWNFVSALTSLLGVLAGYLLISSNENITAFLLPLAAGGFIYIAMSDLIPELHKEPKISKSVLNFAIFILGVGFMLWIKLHFGG